MSQPAPTWFVTSVRKQHTSEKIKTRLLNTLILFVCWRYVSNLILKTHACLSTAFATSQVSETSSACLLSNYAFFSCYSLHLQLPEEQWSCLRQTISWQNHLFAISCKAAWMLPNNFSPCLTVSARASPACSLSASREARPAAWGKKLKAILGLLVIL